MGAGGQPPKYSDYKELEEKIMDYFESISYTVGKVDKNGDAIYNLKGERLQELRYGIPPSVQGLANHLGVHRDTLHSMQTERGERFSDLIKMAKQKIEMYLIENCSKKDKPMGDIFVLECGFKMKRQKDDDQYQLAKEKLEIEKIKADKGINDDDKTININLYTNGDKNDKQGD